MNECLDTFPGLRNDLGWQAPTEQTEMEMEMEQARCVLAGPSMSSCPVRFKVAAASPLVRFAKGGANALRRTPRTGHSASAGRPFTATDWSARRTGAPIPLTSSPAQTTGVRCLMKGAGKKAAGCELDGQVCDEFPILQTVAVHG